MTMTSNVLKKQIIAWCGVGLEEHIPFYFGGRGFFAFWCSRGRIFASSEMQVWWF